MVSIWCKAIEGPQHLIELFWFYFLIRGLGPSVTPRPSR